MTKPVALLEVSYEDPTADPTWVDESAYLRAFNIDRGRQFELDQQQAGRCALTLDNRDGRFDPGNTAGDNYPYMLPMRRVRLSTTLDATVPATFTMRSSNVGSTAALRAGDGAEQLFLFTGFMESISETWQLANGDAAVTIACVDAFKVFNLSHVTWAMFADGLDALGNQIPGCGFGDSNVFVQAIPGHPSGERIAIVLDCADWPADMQNLDTGTIWISGRNGFGVPIPLDDVNVLTYLQDVADTEGGILFIDTEGKVRFIDADHLSVPTIVNEIYGGQTGEIGYLDAVVGYDDQRLYNYIDVATGDQVAGTVTDATSITQFYERRLSKTYLETQIPGDHYSSAWLDDAATRADELLAKYKDPQIRITSLTLSPMHEADWLSVLRHDLGDFIRVKKRPADADEIDQTLRIEGISVQTGSFDLDNWTVVFRTSN